MRFENRKTVRAAAAGSPDSVGAEMEKKENSMLPGGGKKPCLRCLLQDMPEEAVLAQSLRELIALIPPEERAAEETVRKRLAACRACGHMGRGTCGLCGCYVEHRAEKKRADCPDLPSRWRPETAG